MKKFRLLIVSLSVLLLLSACSTKADSLPKGAVEQEFSVKGMNCASCSAGIEWALNDTLGVYGAKVNFMTKNGFVIYDPDLTGREDFIKAGDPYEMIFD